MHPMHPDAPDAPDAPAYRLDSIDPGHRGHYDPPMDSAAPAFALICPVCGGQIDKVSERRNHTLFACKECACDVIVPTTAWEIARLKREERWHAKRLSSDPAGRIPPLQKSLAAGRGTPEK